MLMGGGRTRESTIHVPFTLRNARTDFRRQSELEWTLVSTGTVFEVPGKVPGEVPGSGIASVVAIPGKVPGEVPGSGIVYKHTTELRSFSRFRGKFYYMQCMGSM